MLLVDLTNILYNINYIKNFTNKEIIAVVKSDCYGLGAKRIVKYLCSIGINYFFVNHYEEYKKIKDSIHNEFVIIMDSMNKLYDDPNIIYTVNNINDAIIYATTNKRITVHFQVDVGMNRMGFRSLQEMKHALDILKRNKLINIEGIYCHFPSLVNDLKDYHKRRSYVLEYLKLYHFKMKHFNSTSTLNDLTIGNYVRIGISMYGYGNPYLYLKPVLSFTSKFTKIIPLKKGDSVGYLHDNSYLSSDSLVGVLPLGYYEIPDLEYVTVNNEKLPKIGVSCMNHSHYIVNDKINDTSLVSIFKKNDIIEDRLINWYHRLIKVANNKKGYIIRKNYDIYKVIKKRTKKSQAFRLRRKCYQVVSPRVIRL